MSSGNLFKAHPEQLSIRPLMSPARVATGSRIRERTLANRERILFLVSERAMSKSGGVWNGWNGGFEYGVDKVISGMQNVLVRCQKIMAATYIIT